MPSEINSVWMPRSRWPIRLLTMAFGIVPMPVWMQEPSATRSATKPASRRDVRRRRRLDLDERYVVVVPSDDLADVDLIAAERPRHLRVGLDEEPRLPMKDAT